MRHVTCSAGSGQSRLKLLLGDDARVATVAVFGPAILLPAGGQDGDAVADFFTTAVVTGDGAAEITHEPTGGDHLALQMQRDGRAVDDALTQAAQHLLPVLAAVGGKGVAQVAAQFCFLFHEMDGETLLGQREGGRQPGRAAAYHQR